MTYEQRPNVEDGATHEDFRRKSVPSIGNSNCEGYVGKGSFQENKKASVAGPG